MIRRYDRPAQPVDPYPEGPVRIAGFRYDSALTLLRLRDAVKLRTGEDADYLTYHPYAVSWHAGDGVWRQIVVPSGLITDLTSVPGPLRWIVGRVGPWLEAAIVHDYLYIAWQDVPGREPRPEDKRFADAIMLAGMQEAGVRRWTARAIFWAISWFGGRTFAARNADRYVDISDPAIRVQLMLRIPRD